MEASAEDCRIVNALPATCAAIISILKKDDNAGRRFAASIFIQRACLFAEFLQELGFENVNTTVTEKDIHAQERRILSALEWRIRVPTIESWMGAFISRFNVFSRGMLQPQLGLVWQHGLLGASRIMIQQAVNPEVPPRVLATGLFCIGLVNVNLLHLESLQPSDMTGEEWVRLFNEVQPRAAHSQGGLPPKKHWQGILELLSMAVGVSVAEIGTERLAAIWQIL